MRKSAFRDWFKAQYGRFPNEAARQRLQVKVHDAEFRLHELRRELELEERIARQMQDALYGWNAGKRA